MRYVIRRLRRYWSQFFLVVIALGIVGVAWILFPPPTQQPIADRFVPISLHSALIANYAGDPQARQVSSTRLDLVAEAIRDEEPEIDPAQLARRMDNLFDQLQTPVLNVGPVTPTPTATATATATPSPTPTATSTSTSTSTSTATSTPAPTSTRTPTPTSTATPSATATPSPTNTPRPPSPTSTPTATASPTNTPRPPATPTATPTATATPAVKWIGRIAATTDELGGWQGVIRVWVIGQTELPVTITETSSAWRAEVLTGSKKEYGPYALEVAPLNPGRYIITPRGLGISLTVEVEPGHTVEVLFARESDLN